MRARVGKGARLGVIWECRRRWAMAAGAAVVAAAVAGTALVVPGAGGATAERTAAAVATQPFAASTGLGSLEAARGDAQVQRTTFSGGWSGRFWSGALW